MDGRQASLDNEGEEGDTAGSGTMISTCSRRAASRETFSDVRYSFHDDGLQRPHAAVEVESNLNKTAGEDKIEMKAHETTTRSGRLHKGSP
jgi:hypothetical protein